MRSTLLLALLIATALPASAHHTGTPPIVRFTSTGDNALPRTPAQGDILGLEADGSTSDPIVSLKVFNHPELPKTLASTGHNANPAAATSPAVAWDSDANFFNNGSPGRQVYLSVNGVLTQLTHDASGTSTNPAINAKANRVAFESSGNLTNGSMLGIQQVYFRNIDGSLQQVSRGLGTSGNPSLNGTGNRLVFESTSDPGDDHDTGVSQIWYSTLDGTLPRAITAGLGSSSRAEITGDGKVIAFESVADLANGGANTGIPQIFIYHIKTATFAQVTSDATGCSGASARKTLADYRIAFTCAGQAYYYDLRRDRRYHVQTPGGDVGQLVVEFGTYFLGIATTANLLEGGTTADHQLFMVNLWKRPADLVAGTAVWFPTRGISPLH